LKAFNFNKLLQRIPELKAIDCEIETLSFEDPIDSSNMNPSEWSKDCNVIESTYDHLMVCGFAWFRYYVLFFSSEFYVEIWQSQSFYRFTVTYR
jgi:hypothetical protein